MAGFDREGIAWFQVDDEVDVDRLIFITQRACFHGAETGAWLLFTLRHRPVRPDSDHGQRAPSTGGSLKLDALPRRQADKGRADGRKNRDLASVDIGVFRINQSDLPLLAADVVDERHLGLHRYEIDFPPLAPGIVKNGTIGGNDFGAVDFPSEKFGSRRIFFYRSLGKVPQAIDIVRADGDGREVCLLQIVEHVFHRGLALASDRPLIERSPARAAQPAMSWHRAMRQRNNGQLEVRSNLINPGRYGRTSVRVTILL